MFFLPTALWMIWLGTHNPGRPLLGGVVLLLGLFTHFRFRERSLLENTGRELPNDVDQDYFPFRGRNVRWAVEAQRELYRAEYAEPVHPTSDCEISGIVASRSLIPEALHHAFATIGVLMSPALPLSRRQREMITTVVSTINRCHY